MYGVAEISCKDLDGQKLFWSMDRVMCRDLRAYDRCSTDESYVAHACKIHSKKTKGALCWTIEAIPPVSTRQGPGWHP